jgi:hypothetical protein
MSYDCRKLESLLNQKFWADYTLRHNSGIWQNFAMTSLETLNTNFAIDKLSFHWLLIWLVLIHSLIATGFKIRVRC